MGVSSIFAKLKKAKEAFSDPQTVNKIATDKGEETGRIFSKVGKGLIYLVFGGILLFFFFIMFFAKGFFRSLFKIPDND